MSYRVLFSNIGYAKGIDGSLRHHVGFFGRHFYCQLPVQEQVLAQLKAIIDAGEPDLCCFVEIDSGSLHTARFNQIEALVDTEYHFYDIADKYGHESWLGRMPFHQGKSNAFLARRDISFERLYFTHGTKRLIYHLSLPGDISLLFAHFSLRGEIRVRQFEEMRLLLQKIPGEIMILADFNILKGFNELDPWIQSSGLCILNREDDHTFTFHQRKLALDLCICSQDLARRSTLKIIPQPFSDHAALLVNIEGIG